MSNTPLTYCIDTSSLIEAWVRHYPQDVFPAVWLKLEELIAEGRFCAPEEVRTEIERKEDGLAKWTKRHKSLFVPLDQAQIAAVQQVLRTFPLLVDSSKNRSGGDPFVIALAKLKSYTVVTQEFASKTSSASFKNLPGKGAKVYF